MRIIAGSAKGRRLASPGETTRPMTDRAREGLFSSLATTVPGARVLDLYAGAGTMGLEALSRGAAHVTFVERDRAALRSLRSNVAAVGLGGDVVAGDVTLALAELQGPFDLAFVDPPYAVPLPSVNDVLARLAVHLEEDGVVIVHRRKDGEAPSAPGFALVDRRSYGSTELFRLVKERA